MRPDIAAESGHLSEFTLSNNATMMYMNDMKSVWVANDTIVVLIPGWFFIVLPDIWCENISCIHVD